MTSVKSLECALRDRNEGLIIENLSTLLQNQVQDDTNILQLGDNTIPKMISSLNPQNEKIHRLFVELSAEWCKSEHNRAIYTDKTIVEFLFSQLERSELDEVMTVASIRALGNICYENDLARKLITNDNLSTVISILERDGERRDVSLTLKTSGFLVNLLNSNEELQQEALGLDIMNIVGKLLHKYRDSRNEVLFSFLLNILNNLVDYIDDMNVTFGESLCCTVVEIFKVGTTPEVCVSCLEILHGQSDKEDIKNILAKEGVCELVIDLIAKYRDRVNDEDSRSILKMACDMIVIILTGDEYMDLLYNQGRGKVFDNMTQWLDSSDTDLLSTAILAIGNFARNDAHCMQMVENGISKKLIDLLAKYNTGQSDLKVQHALLSALKNLTIPQRNKGRILEQGLIEVIYPMIEIEQWLVVFKLLGTFRMVIDGQEKAAFNLISQKRFIEKLIYWSEHCDHLGVRGEIPRLLSWLIKNCKSFRPLNNVIETPGATKCLVEMSSSNHAVMQNESFYALNLMALGCDNAHRRQEFKRQLIESEIGKNLKFVINKYGDKMDKGTVENLMTLLEHLVAMDGSVRSHMTDNDLGECLKKLLKDGHEARINKIISQIV